MTQRLILNSIEIPVGISINLYTIGKSEIIKLLLKISDPLLDVLLGRK